MVTVAGDGVEAAAAVAEVSMLDGTEETFKMAKQLTCYLQPTPTVSLLATEDGRLDGCDYGDDPVTSPRRVALSIVRHQNVDSSIQR